MRQLRRNPRLQANPVRRCPLSRRGMRTELTTESANVEVTIEAANLQQQGRLLLTPTEAAKALGISRASLYLLLMRKEIPSIRVGGVRCAPVAALHRSVGELLIAQRSSNTKRLTSVRRAV